MYKRRPNSKGNAVLGIEDKIKHWTDYMRGLFGDEKRGNLTALNYSAGPQITNEKLLSAIKKSKSNKGPDNITGDVLKLIQEQNLM